MENWNITGCIMFSWAYTSSCLVSEHREQWQQYKWGSCNSRCHSVCWPATTRQEQFKLLSKDIRASSSTPACTDDDAEVLSCISACQTYVGDDDLAFWNSTSAYPSLAPLAQDLLATLASQAYVERLFSVCGNLTAGKRNRLCKKLANRAFPKINYRNAWQSLAYSPLSAAMSPPSK